MGRSRIVVFFAVLFSMFILGQVEAQGWTVAMFYGDPVDLGDGWQMCDGTNGTPDMRDQFVVGAGDGYTLGDTGGTITNTLDHRHQVEDHAHAVYSQTATVESWTPAQPITVALSVQSPTGGAAALYTDYQLTGDQENRPPFMALYYACYSGTLAYTDAITDPLTTDYWQTEGGATFARVRTVDTGQEITNYLLIALILLIAVKFLFEAITGGKRKWN